jgi:hypothetical protein
MLNVEIQGIISEASRTVAMMDAKKALVDAISEVSYEAGAQFMTGSIPVHEVRATVHRALARVLKLYEEKTS